MYRGALAIVSTALAAGVLAAAPLAAARNGADDGSASSRGGGGKAAVVRVAGTCTDGSTAKLKIKPDNGRVEVEFEVDENRNRSRWGVALKRNGKRVVSRAAVTRAPSGSFSVKARVARSPRTRIVAVARRAATGEVCRATATLPR